VPAVLGERVYEIEALVCVVESGGRFETVRVYEDGGVTVVPTNVAETLRFRESVVVQVGVVPVQFPPQVEKVYPV
jgi:hypothetical protein